MESPSQALCQLLSDQQPRRLLSCSQEPIPAVEAYCESDGCELTRLAPPYSDTDLTRYDLAVVANCLEHLDHARGTTLLARLRNVHSHRIWVLVDGRAGWQLTDFIALGFQRLQVFNTDPQSGGEARSYHSYGYDIGQYNHVRSWNNPRFWANPENFGKYWW